MSVTSMPKPLDIAFRKCAIRSSTRYGRNPFHRTILQGRYDRERNIAYDRVEFDGMMPGFSSRDISFAFSHDYIETDYGLVNIDILSNDAIDLTMILADRNRDDAFFLNGVGPGRNSSRDVNRIAAQFAQRNKYGPDEYSIMKNTLSPLIQGTHYKQIVSHLAINLNEEPSVVDGILRMRMNRDGLIITNITKKMYDINYDFWAETFLWRTIRAIHVHVPQENRSEIKLYVEVRRRLAESTEWREEFRSLHASHGKGFDKYAIRRSNGISREYPSLLFPPSDEMAEELLKLIEQNADITRPIVCRSIFSRERKNYTFGSVLGSRVRM